MQAVISTLAPAGFCSALPARGREEETRAWVVGGEVQGVKRSCRGQRTFRGIILPHRSPRDSRIQIQIWPFRLL